MICIEGLHERYSVSFNDGKASIGRPEINMKPSGEWLLRGLVRLNNFGNEVDFVPWDRILEKFGDGRDLRFKNGKPQWFMADIDHGTSRIMREGVKRVYAVDARNWLGVRNG